MKKVALFKSESEDYHNAFLDKNYKAIFVEPLQFEFVGQHELSDKLLCADYTGIILTSPRAIEAVSKCWDPTKFSLWSKKRVYTVGDTSSHKVKLLLGLETLGSSSGNAENLAKIIVSENSSHAKFFFPCGNLRSETLPNVLKSNGITIDALTVYETQENEKLRSDLMELNKCEAPCCMVFFSPSGCEYTHRQLQTFSNNLSSLPHFAIGNSTAHKIQNLGVEVAGVAAKPQAQSVVLTVHNYFTSGSLPQ